MGLKGLKADLGDLPLSFFQLFFLFGAVARLRKGAATPTPGPIYRPMGLKGLKAELGDPQLSFFQLFFLFGTVARLRKGAASGYQDH